MAQHKTKKKISSIRLYRFQSYSDEIIKFDPYTNAIIGKTDAGKSAITRALYWVLYNRPVKSRRGELVTWGEKHCFVTVTFSDGTEITRGRKNEENYYRLKKPGEEVEEFTGFGFEVPPQIMEAHGMLKMDLDDGSPSFSLNISQQLEPIFLFDDSSTKRAKIIGKISGADTADGGIGVINNWRNEARSRQKDINKSIKEKTEQLKSFEIIEDLDVAISTLEELVGLISSKEGVYKQLLEYLEHLKNLQVEKETLLAVVSYENNLISLSELENKLHTLHTELQRIRQLHDTHKQNLIECINLNNFIVNEDKLTYIERYIDEAYKKKQLSQQISRFLVDYTDLSNQITAITLVLKQADTLDEVVNILSKLDEKVKLLYELRNVYNEYAELHTRRSKGNEVIQKLEGDYNKAIQKYKEYLEIVEECPFCKSKITSEQIEKIAF